MKKSLIVLFFSALFSVAAFAQSVQEGVGHLNAERTASAKATFEKLLAANPNNIEAMYWLGQTHLATDNIAAARQVYEKGLSSNGNAPLIMVGLGQVELEEGKTAEARQHFETAISLSRGKKGDDPNILNAIGRANIEAKNGDPAYAIAKLTAASAAAPNNADIYINLGNAYRLAKDGGQAVANYTKALQGTPALAYYRMARVYETQKNWDVVTENLSKSIAADPKFAPAYLRQYVMELFYKNNNAAADQWAQKYVAVADPSIQNEIYKAQPLFLQKRYDDVIAIGNKILAQKDEKPSDQVYRMMAYSYMEKGDTATAKQYVDQLFANTKKEKMVAKDYTLKAAIYSKEAPDQVVNIYLDAAAEDTTLRNKLLILQEAADWAKTAGKKVAEADIRLALYRLNPNSNPAALFQIGLPYYQGKAFQKADSVFQAYSRAFPDSVFGYLWSARSLASIDTSGKIGSAIPQYERLLTVASTDKVRFKSYGVEAAGQLANYHVNVKGDKAKGIEYLEKGLEFDPGNVAFTGAIDRLKKSSTPGKATPPVKKTSTSANSAKGEVKVKAPVKKKG
jgi:tetratricopeptide (TPR) repeat protein